LRLITSIQYYINRHRTNGYNCRFEETSYADYYDYESTKGRSKEDSLKDYEEMKELLQRRTQRFGAGLAAYLFLTVSGEVKKG
jgi:hypothetical protein